MGAVSTTFWEIDMQKGLWLKTNRHYASPAIIHSKTTDNEKSVTDGERYDEKVCPNNLANLTKGTTSAGSIAFAQKR